jgi:hypothetical protein
MESPQPSLYRLDAPDSTFQLSSVDRANVRTGFDADALERLLAWVVPEARVDILHAFQWPPQGEAARNIVQFQDTGLNALLDEVWLPMWEQVSPESLDDETKPFPGLQLARQRRAAKSGRLHPES